MVKRSAPAPYRPSGPHTGRRSVPEEIGSSRRFTTSSVAAGRRWRLCPRPTGFVVDLCGAGVDGWPGKGCSEWGRMEGPLVGDRRRG